MITKEEAIEELMYQSGTHPDYENQNERWENGFLHNYAHLKDGAGTKEAFWNYNQDNL